MDSLGVFDCFCGLGGISLGAAQAGHSIVGGVDSDREAIEVFSSSFKNSTAINADLQERNAVELLKSNYITRNDVDVLAGGPPCQSFSINNHRRGEDDPRSALISHYFSIVGYLRPKWLVIENVPGLKSISKGRLLENFLLEISKRGYHPRCIEVNSINFGVPQRRKRLIIVASQEKNKTQLVSENLLSQSAKPISVWEAISDLPPSTAKKSEYKTSSRNYFQREMRKGKRKAVDSHVSHGLGKINQERISYVPQGGNWRDIPRELLPSGMQRARLSDHTTRYGRLAAEKPSFTILTKCDPHWGCYFHPFEDRVISVREASRLQSIPDAVTFPERIASAYRLVGNAVPPLLSRAIFNQLT